MAAIGERDRVKMTMLQVRVTKDHSGFYIFPLADNVNLLEFHVCDEGAKLIGMPRVNPADGVFYTQMLIGFVDNRNAMNRRKRK